MKQLVQLFFPLFLIVLSVPIFSQNIQTETVEYVIIKMPEKPLGEEISEYGITIEIPYKLTKEDADLIHLQKFELKKSKYQEELAKAKEEHNQKLNDYYEKLERIEKDYERDIEAFNKKSFLERAALEEQGKKPQLKRPVKPQLIEPYEPQFRDIDYDDYMIYDTKILENEFEVIGLNNNANGTNSAQLELTILEREFKVNGDEIYSRHPARLITKVNGVVVDEYKSGIEFEKVGNGQLESYTNVNQERKSFENLLEEIELYATKSFGNPINKGSINLQYVKNNKQEYNDIENAKILAASGFKKLKFAEKDEEAKASANSKIQEAKALWRSELEKVNYEDKKARVNKKVAAILYFNLLRVELAFGNAKEAMNLVEEIESNLIQLDFNYDNQQIYNRLEKKTYEIQ